MISRGCLSGSAVESLANIPLVIALVGSEPILRCFCSSACHPSPTLAFRMVCIRMVQKERRSRFSGRGCDEALFSEKGVFQ